jgi:hypothetical protein
MLAGAVAGAWRLGFSPPPWEIGGGFAASRVALLCFASLDTASSPGSPGVGCDPSYVSCAFTPNPRAGTHLGELLFLVQFVLLSLSFGGGFPSDHCRIIMGANS